jgi:hypothetical protein
MAINPNTDFTAGQILTAAQQNRFPRGVVAFSIETGSITVNGTETVRITSTSFTAVANRYYKITYHEPALLTTVAGAGTTMRVRLTNISGAVQQTADASSSGASSAVNSQTLSIVKTFSAGSVVLVGTLQGSVGNEAFRGASQVAYLLVEDLGPA